MLPPIHRSFPRTLVLVLVATSACTLSDDVDDIDLDTTTQEVLVGGVDVSVPFPFVTRRMDGRRRVELPLGMNRLRLPDGDTLDPQLAELGNLLFFDRRLSKGAEMSCSTCHEPRAGYSARDFVFGVDGNRLPRTASTALNRAFGTLNGWSGSKTLEEQSSAPITSPDEMGLTRSQLLNTVHAIPGYVDRFQRLRDAGVILGNPVSVANIERAIATFQRLRLMSGNSAVDRYEAGDASALTARQKNGRRLFHTQARCVLCHSGPNYTDEKFHFIIPGQSADPGRIEITGVASDFGKFKTPSLRNAALRKPYFHNGDPLHSTGMAFTLEEVVRRYNGGPSAGGSPLVIPLGLTVAQQHDVAAFLRGLTGPIPVDPWLSRAGVPQSTIHRENIYLSPAIFNITDYRNRYDDLAGLSDGAVRRHWLNTGMDEGRIGVRSFFVGQYIQLHPSVHAAVTGKPNARRLAFDHYLDHGRRLGLAGRHIFTPGFFSLQDYRALNGSATALLSEEDATYHYMTKGQTQRLPSRRKPKGYFMARVNGTMTYNYADGVSRCRFASASAQRSNRRRTNDVGVPRFGFMPPNLQNGGACQTESRPPTMSRPGQADTGSFAWFQCRRQDNNAACSKRAQCPAGTRVRAIRAACNLESGPVTAAQVRDLKWNQLKVLRRSNNVAQGHCRAAGMDIAFGDVGLFVPRANRREVVIGCKEHDSNGGECHIRAQLLCAP